MALSELAERECLELLARRVIGRVAVVVAGAFHALTPAGGPIRQNDARATF
jgi:hypothetical protein